MTDGILYITYGNSYTAAAVRSAKTARARNPGLAIHLFVDAASRDSLGLARDPGPFSSIGIIENPHRRSKVDYMCKTPFERTLYLDSDTSVAQDIQEIFGVLERFDLAAVQVMRRNANRKDEMWTKPIPDAYPQFNSGVMLYRNTPEVIKILDEWGKAFGDSGHHHDQAILRELLWDSDLRVIALPPEYNVRYLKYVWIWSKAEAIPMIYHLKQYHVGWVFWFKKHLRDFRRLVMGKRRISKVDRGPIKGGRGNGRAGKPPKGSNLASMRQKNGTDQQ